MKRVLLPTDFSDNSRNAIEYALQLLGNQECTFFLLHTYTPAVYHAEYVFPSPGQIGLGDVYQTEAQEKLNELKSTLSQSFPNPGHSFYTHCANNALEDEVRKMVKKEVMDLVVMGTQGATGAKEIFFGTHAVRVIKKAPCPVIVVPPGVVYVRPDTILFPTDYGADFNKLPLATLREIIMENGSELAIIHISTGYDLDEKHQRSKKDLAVYFDRVRPSFHDLPPQEIQEGINTFLAMKAFKLLVMVNNRHSFLEQLVKEPVIAKVAFHVGIPFMVIPG